MNTDANVRVVIVEDDFLITKTISRILQNLNYELVGTAPNGLKGVEMVKDLQPDVVLMDIQMPKMDGITASEIITRECPTPIVIITAHETMNEVEKARDAGAAAYLTKPPNMIAIQRAIIIAIARHNDILELRQLNQALEDQKQSLESALSELKQLSGLLPICAHCKNIRDENNNWQRLEVYIDEHSEAEFSHGVCPECAEKYFPGIAISSSE